jgi:hypothetical protein
MAKLEHVLIYHMDGEDEGWYWLVQYEQGCMEPAPESMGPFPTLLDVLTDIKKCEAENPILLEV